jgi:hypothetical protein
MSIIYRGVSQEMYKQLNGKLIPAGNKIKSTLTRGDFSEKESILRGQHFDRVPSERNTVRGHQIESGIHDGCFISTTKDYQEAVKFATKKGMADGFIYFLDSSLFSSLGIVSIEFDDPPYDEQEISIRALDGGEMPLKAVTKIVAVKTIDFNHKLPNKA